MDEDLSDFDNIGLDMDDDELRSRLNSRRARLWPQLGQVECRTCRQVNTYRRDPDNHEAEFVLVLGCDHEDPDEQSARVQTWISNPRHLASWHD